jgi:ATP-dependent DNA helicase RecQ
LKKQFFRLSAHILIQQFNNSTIQQLNNSQPINSTAQEILEKYWGYSSFRPRQEEIILSVLEGNNTLALLPTGGGKSVCYQVPALMKPGLCLVISPLIALMKDQVDVLREKGIKALYLFSGMKPREIDITLDNAAYGDYKFLYVSPERLQTDLFQARAQKLNVSLIAVDEAHCISQWGYDFRPPYLKIAEIRKYFPQAPMLALTATATARVQKDILEKLDFGKKLKVFKQSFDRENLIYSVLHEENKAGRLLRLLEMIPGTAIVYGGYRRICKEMAVHLQQHNISADYYHAGLSHEDRSRKQEAWKSGKTRVMVCTNAFGMGIDKADVRQVVHLNMPGSLEAYYQETGRAGRDGARAYAVALVNAHDIEELKNRPVNHLQPQYLKHVYQALANFLQVPEESGAGQSFDFDIGDFAKRYDFIAAEAYKALKELENAGYISLTESVFLPARLMILADHEMLYAFQLSQPEHEPVIKTILRSYGGCFEEYVSINEKNIAQRLDMPVKKVIETLLQLHKLNLIDYEPQKTGPQITFILPRLAPGDLLLGNSELADRKVSEKEKTESVILYANAGDRCRGKILLSYFGEEIDQNCGHCDYCIKKSKAAHEKGEEEEIQQLVEIQLKEGKKQVRQLIALNPGIDEKQFTVVIRWMLDRNIIRFTEEQYLELTK